MSKSIVEYIKSSNFKIDVGNGDDLFKIDEVENTNDIENDDSFNLEKNIKIRKFKNKDKFYKPKKKNFIRTNKESDIC